MNKEARPGPADDPDQFVVDPVDDQEHYLGNAAVVHRFVGEFANEVVAAYDLYLHGEQKAPEVQAKIEALIKQYGDGFMGRDPAYQIAPWQGQRMKGKLLVAIPSMKGDDDPGEALFRLLSLQCIKAAIAMAKGMDADMAGARLREILDDVRGRILGVIV